MKKELKTYQEYNGFKVGHTAYVDDLLEQDGIVFLIKGSSYKPDKKRIGKGEILAIFDKGFAWYTLGFNPEECLLIRGELGEDIFYEE